MAQRDQLHPNKSLWTKARASSLTAECIVNKRALDDLFIVSHSEDAVAAIQCVLKDKYGQFELKSDKSSHLGMEIESLSNNSIRIKQSGYLQSILRKCDSRNSVYC